ncbi:DUF4229 domain-containing protein [Amnibacterium sp.]|uniref:DUF4229 domain-containing protein n=1 Tax=Amnibacterium sp. TaxID=1872496 RepID=UPI003F7CD0DB
MAGNRNSFALAFAAYTALRLLVFVVPLVVIYALSGNPILSAVIAAVIGFALSMILLVRQRSSMATGLAERSDSRRTISDEAIEDEAVDETTEDEAVDGQNDSAAASPRP